MHTVNVVFDWFPNTNHTGFLIAQKKGYFKEVGIDVCLHGEVHGVMETHGADLILAPEMSILEKIAEGVPLTTVATLTQRCDSGIVSLKKSNIKSPKDLEGKRLTHWEPKWFHGVIRELMRADGGDYDKVELIQLDVGDIVYSMDNVADATWVYANWENFELMDAGKEINYFALADYGTPFNFCAPNIAADRHFLESRPDVLRAFMHALSKGYIDAANHPEESVLLVKDGLPDKSDKMLIESQKHLSKIFLDDKGRWGHIDAERWDAMADFMISKGLYDKRRPTEYTNEFLVD